VIRWLLSKWHFLCAMYEMPGHYRAGMSGDDIVASIQRRHPDWFGPEWD
jgi:hypothetical protein